MQYFQLVRNRFAPRRRDLAWVRAVCGGTRTGRKVGVPMVALASGSGGGMLCVAAGSIGYIAYAARGGEARGRSSGVYFVRGKGWHGVGQYT